jgi:hypothetical protein
MKRDLTVVGQFLLAAFGLTASELLWGAATTSQSSIGLSAEYASNPYLLSTEQTASEALALVATLPITYTTDTQTLDLVPSVREALNHGDVAALSDYEYLNGDWHLGGELTTLTVSGFWHRDSTLYQPFEAEQLQGKDLLRLEDSETLTLQRLLTERSDMQVSASWDAVDYSGARNSGLQGYTYGQAIANFEYNLSERWKWTAAGYYGRYVLQGGDYTSDTRGVQTSVSGAISEVWLASLSAGYYSLSSTQEEPTYEIVIGPGGEPEQVIVYTAESTTKAGGNYAMTLTRHGERTEVDLAASQSIQPSGLGALLVEDDYSAGIQYSWSPRLTVSGKVHEERLSDSVGQAIPGGRRIDDANISIGWDWTEKLRLQLSCTYLVAAQNANFPETRATTVYLNLLRQFGLTRLR